MPQIIFNHSEIAVVAVAAAGQQLDNWACGQERIEWVVKVANIHMFKILKMTSNDQLLNHISHEEPTPVLALYHSLKPLGLGAITGL